ncbi:polymorphic toxin type 24 domain-containing protein [Aerosakkonemataceae cyanobacterium BLCC-F154]|uniref:Polymorphic toxin type 24 domain-containing protein n=1 Tax=Floridaenema fluviatile BLCC-F154 TaxID=3153640 RepID=A0ABV4YHM1_9CYAN
MPKPVDWTVGISASILIANATQVSGKFLLDGANPREVRYRMDGNNITSYIVYDDNGRAIKRVDLTGKAHAGISTPHVVEYKHNKNPIGDIFIQAEKLVRPATATEIA